VLEAAPQQPPKVKAHQYLDGIKRILGKYPVDYTHRGFPTTGQSIVQREETERREKRHAPRAKNLVEDKNQYRLYTCKGGGSHEVQF
jgi:hypothetical protein